MFQLQQKHFMDNTEIKKSYWSVIPASVRYSKKIPDGAKLLYSEITALCNDKGYCWAGNEYFAGLYGKEKRTISRWITSLVGETHIYVDSTSGKRKIFLAQAFSPDTSTPTPPITPVENDAEDTPKHITKKPIKKIIVKKSNPDDLFLAELLLSKIIYNFPTFENKKVKIEDWAEDIRKLREIDKASVDQINFMITWVHGGEILKDGKPTHKFEPHEFWAKNIMSANKLRKQWFNNLVPQLQEAVKKHIKKNVPTQL